MKERREILEEKDVSVKSVVAAIKYEKVASDGDVALYNVFKSTE